MVNASTVLLLGLFVLQVLCAQDTPCTKQATIIDDDKLNAIVAKARDKFLATRPYPFSRLDSTILIPQAEDGTWLRGSFNQTEVAYPASCVKLAYLAASVHWCEENGLQYDCLDSHVRPMITISDNFQTGVVVDYITGTPNLPLTEYDDQFYAWLALRNYTMEYFDSRGLLENQLIVHKTLPSNSGYDLNGAEELARSLLGMNAMNPKCSASLMLEISQGKISADARRYMLGVLNHQRESSYSSYGMGTPPGTLLYNKVGNAYDTLQEIAYMILPNEQPFILATFTNGYESNEPAINNLMYYAELLIDSIPQLNQNLPPKYVFGIYVLECVVTVTDCSSDEFYKTGSYWHQGTARDSYGDYFYYNTNPAGQLAGWKFAVAQDGMYEVAVWHPEFSTQASDVQHTVYHRDGTDTFTVNERHNGGRWVKLGDFNFSAGVVAEVRVIAETSEVKSVAVDALRVAMYPSCNTIPGTSCIATIM